MSDKKDIKLEEKEKKNLRVVANTSHQNIWTSKEQAMSRKIVPVSPT
jgi:hypothetical protein